MSWTRIGARPGTPSARVQRADRCASLYGISTRSQFYVRKSHAALENGQHAPVEVEAARRVVRLEALGGQVVGRRPPVLVAGRNQPAARFILFGERTELVAHLRPGGPERRGSGGVRLLGGLL